MAEDLLTQDFDNEANRLSAALQISELQARQRQIEADIDDLKLKLQATVSGQQEHFKSIEKSVLEIRDMARDALHISIGVDGKNGLRGSLESLVRDVASMTESFNILRQTANSYTEMKTLMLRLFVASAMTIMCQFGGAVWLVSSLHSRQESMRQDLNRVLTLLDKQFETTVKPQISPSK